MWPRPAASLPQFNEVGVPAFDGTAWAGLLAPVDTPRDIVDKLASAAAKAARSGPDREFTSRIGATAVGSTPAEFSTFLAAGRAR
ncbi:MAG TPA: tripartite tricarboxylate transporter substrate-binding protein [Hyphomicrobiaceae bacterium]|nr:tripartite tricarboxylate transporter substrate-binding protein [Hyphomicrobiaceae bacterium]